MNTRVIQVVQLMGCVIPPFAFYFLAQRKLLNKKMGILGTSLFISMLVVFCSIDISAGLLTSIALFFLGISPLLARVFPIIVDALKRPMIFYTLILAPGTIQLATYIYFVVSTTGRSYPPIIFFGKNLPWVDGYVAMLTILVYAAYAAYFFTLHKKYPLLS